MTGLHASATVRAAIMGVIALDILVVWGGFGRRLFDSIWWYDELAHLLTGFTVTVTAALFLYNRVLIIRRQRLLFVLTVTMIGLGIGGLWEIGEWVIDQLLTPQQALIDNNDTISDLIMDTTGAVLAGIVAVATARTGLPGEPNEPSG